MSRILTNLRNRLTEGHLEDLQVNTRHLTSEFIGHGTADVLYEKLLRCVQNIGYRGLLQLSIDGPYTMLANDMEREANHKLLNVDSCSLHQNTMHLEQVAKKQGGILRAS